MNTPPSSVLKAPRRQATVVSRRCRDLWLAGIHERETAGAIGVLAMPGETGLAEQRACWSPAMPSRVLTFELDLHRSWVQAGIDDLRQACARHSEDFELPV